MIAISKLKLVTAAVLAGLTAAGRRRGRAGEGGRQTPAATAPKLRPDLNDKEFLKRVCDSLRGSPATPAEIGYFVADKDAAKRKKVVAWLTEEPKADGLRTQRAPVRPIVVAATGWTLKPPATLDLTGTSRVALDRDRPTSSWRTQRREEQDRRAAGCVVADDATSRASGRGATQQDASQWLASTDHDVTDAAETDDAFLTRVIESARGGKPTRLEKEYFLADKDAKKREKLLDLILSDPATAKKLGPDWKKNMLNPPQTYSFVYVVDRRHPVGGQADRRAAGGEEDGRPGARSADPGRHRPAADRHGEEAGRGDGGASRRTRRRRGRRWPPRWPAPTRRRSTPTG